MTKKIFICGNSFSHGHYLIKDSMHGPINYNTLQLGQHKPYAEFISQELGVDYVMLAKPIASNYFICKQIEYAIEHKADLVLVNFSSARHIDFTVKEKRLTSMPTLKNLIYEEKTFSPGMQNPTSELDSQQVQCLRYPNLETYARSSNPEYLPIAEYLNHYNDYFLKMDTERLMILGVLSLLKENNIKYIVVDLIEPGKDLPNVTNPSSLADFNILNFMKIDSYFQLPEGFRDRYPNPTDNFHFNEEGHRELAKLLLPMIKESLYL